MFVTTFLGDLQRNAQLEMLHLTVPHLFGIYFNRLNFPPSTSNQYTDDHQGDDFLRQLAFSYIPSLKPNALGTGNLGDHLAYPDTSTWLTSCCNVLGVEVASDGGKAYSTIECIDWHLASRNSKHRLGVNHNKQLEGWKLDIKLNVICLPVFLCRYILYYHLEAQVSKEIL